MQCKVQEHGANSRILAARLKNVFKKNHVKLQNWRFSFSQFQSTVEIHWDLIIAGESVGSAVCFKNPWCQSLIFLGEALISCIVPGNHGLFSGQKKKKILPKMRSPLFCTRISAECSTPASGTAQDTHIDVKHPGRSIRFPWNRSFPCTATVFAFYFLFCFSLEDECRWWKAAC